MSSSDYYLFEHPPRRSQGAPRTTWGFPPAPSGVVAVHDTEGVMDDVGDDWGAENTAAYIVTRDDPGSYHEIHDGDSVVVMAPDHWMTWNVAADSANGHNWGIAAACRTKDWDPDDPWTQRVIRSMARGIVAFWRRNDIDIAKANHWGTRAEANARIPCLILHGTWQPGDRSDAWATHPRRAELDQMLVDAINVAAGLADNPTGDDDMTTLPEVQAEFTNQDRRLAAFLTNMRNEIVRANVDVGNGIVNHLHATVDAAEARLAQAIAGDDADLRAAVTEVLATLEDVKLQTVEDLTPDVVAMLDAPPPVSLHLGPDPDVVAAPT